MKGCTVAGVADWGEGVGRRSVARVTVSPASRISYSDMCLPRGRVIWTLCSV